MTKTEHSLHSRMVIVCMIGVSFLWLTPCYAETIVWAVADRPTSYILSGPDKGKGVVDEVYALLQQQIKDYDHTMEEMTFGRVLTEMEAGNKVCACGFKSPDREKVGVFSIPAIISLPFSIVAKKGHLEPIVGNAERLSLEKLLQEQNLTGGITQQRSYGELDPLIKTHEQAGKFYVHTSTSNLVKMLLADRVDYIIEIPSFARYIAKESGQEAEIVSFAITENVAPVLVAHIFCTNNAWGQQMIATINQILRQERSSPQYPDILERWYDANSRQLLRAYYQNTFLADK